MNKQMEEKHNKTNVYLKFIAKFKKTENQNTHKIIGFTFRRI